jgi:hypothetical protein
MTTWDIEKFNSLLNEWVPVYIGCTVSQSALVLYTECLEQNKKSKYRLIRYDRPNSN